MKINYFCTKTGKPILAEGEQVTEERNNTLAEKLFPGVEWSIGQAYSGITTPEDLQSHPRKTLQFSKTDRFYFANQEGLWQQIFDQPNFASDYGSLLFGDCHYMEERSGLRVLVVDDETGDCGGVLSPEEALKLVGDGDGRIDHSLHESLGNPASTQFQIRGAIPTQVEQEIKATNIIKGTLLPIDLSSLHEGYDLVLSKAQIKGRKNQENKLGLIDPQTGKLKKVGNEIAPGAYKINVILGAREYAEQRTAATGAQFWNALPEGAEKDALPLIEQRLEELRTIACDPRRIAQDYLNTVDKRHHYQYTKLTGNSVETLTEFSLFGLDDLLDTALAENDTETMYKLLKADLEGHLQLLETPKVISFLEEHLQEQYRDCATGRFIRFDRAMAATSQALQIGEVFDPSKPEGEEIIVFRPPVANSNVMGVLKNVYPEGEPIHPGTIKMCRQQMALLDIDTDGDYVSNTLAKDFPYTRDEIKEKTKPENRYAESLSPPKVAREGTLEEIAIDCMDNKIGLVADQAMKILAQENECKLLPPSLSENFLKNLSDSLLEKDLIASIPEGYEERLGTLIHELVNLSTRFHAPDYSHHPLTSEECQTYMKKAQQMFFELSGIIAYQLKLEVQSGKSARHSDSQVLEFCRQISEYPSVLAIEERNKDNAYLHGEVIGSNGHTGLDKMVQATNVAYENTRLVPRPMSQFRDLFRGVSFNEQHSQKAQDYKQQYDTLIHAANNIREEVNANRNHPYLKLIASSAKGNTIEIILNSKETKHPDPFVPQLMDIMLIRDDVNPKSFKAVGSVLGEEGKPIMKENGKPARKQLGYVTPASVEANYDVFKSIAQKQQNHKFLPLGTLSTEVIPGYTRTQEKATFAMASALAEEIQAQIPVQDKEAVAAALWTLSTTKIDEKYDRARKAGAMFAIFPSEIQSRLHTLQFTELTVVGTHFDTSEHYGRYWQGETVPIEVAIAPDPNPKNPPGDKRWVVAEGKKLAVFQQESAQLPTGTTAMAKITSEPSSSVILSTPGGNQLTVSRLKNYSYPHTHWQGEAVQVQIQLHANEKPNKPPTPIALINGKPLGVVDKSSFQTMCEKLESAGVAPQHYSFTAKANSTPSKTAHITIEPATVEYPTEWTRDSIPAPSAPQESQNEEVKGVTPSSPVSREAWENAMFVLIQSEAGIALRPHSDTTATVQRGTMAGGKLQVTHDLSNETLTVTSERFGLLYQAKRGEPARVQKFNPQQQQFFLEALQRRQQQSLQY